MKEAAAAFLGQLKEDGIAYVSATHDVNNPRSGRVMEAIGMHYRYSYVERWMPKDQRKAISVLIASMPSPYKGRHFLRKRLT